MKKGRERGRLHGERQVRRENWQSLRSLTSHQRLPPPHPIKSTLSLALPLSTPCSRVCAANGGCSMHFYPSQRFGCQLGLPSGAGTPNGMRELLPTVPQSLSGFTWNKGCCFKSELGKILTERRENRDMQKNVSKSQKC